MGSTLTWRMLCGWSVDHMDRAPNELSDLKSMVYVIFGVSERARDGMSHVGIGTPFLKRGQKPGVLKVLERAGLPSRQCSK